ncbi:MAG: DNA primase [Eubacteriales bacterium]|nr:DNA primase [Eubacteriales bacterium]
MARLIAQETIDEILATCDLVQLVSEYIALPKHSGSNYYGLCPFHQEKTPSFAVSNERKRYHCFGCREGGDAISFIMHMERLEFTEACEFLAKKLGLELRYKGGKVDYKKEVKARQKLLHLEAARFFYRYLHSPEGTPALNYLLKQRGLSMSTLKRYGVGASPPEHRRLSDYLLSKSFSEEEILAAGLARSGTRGLNDLFRGRVIFPVFDIKGSIIAFGGRVLGDNLPKYVNSPETDIFKKGKELYAFNFAKQSREPRVILCEGYLDVLALSEAGFDNVTAGLGTAFTLEQAKLLLRLRKEIVLCYDSDRAGQKAALSALEILEANGAEVYVCRLPKGLDPDDYIKSHGQERFKALLDKALAGLDFKLALAREAQIKADGSLDLLAYSEAACKLIAEYPNAVQQEIYAARLAKEINVSAAAVQKQIKAAEEASKKARAKDYRPQQRLEQVPQPGEISRAEEIILSALVFGQLNSEDIEVAFNQEIYQSPASRQFIQRLADELTSSDESDEDSVENFSEALRELNSAQLLYRAEDIKIADTNLAQFLSALEADDFRSLNLENSLNSEATAELNNLSTELMRNKRKNLARAAIVSDDKAERDAKLRQLQANDLAKLSREQRLKQSESQKDYFS